MNSQTLRKILLNSNRKNNEKMPNILKSVSHSANRNNKLIKSATINNSSVNISKIITNKRFVHLSKNKYSDFKKDDFQNNNENFELLRDNLIKVKEDYNEKCKELYNLKIKYNRLIEYNRNNLKLLYNSFRMQEALNIARAGSSELENGGNPQQHNMTDSVSFIINLFKLPLVLYIPLCNVRTIF